MEREVVALLVGFSFVDQVEGRERPEGSIWLRFTLNDLASRKVTSLFKMKMPPRRAAFWVASSV
jgi:hypothetical protein